MLPLVAIVVATFAAAVKVCPPSSKRNSDGLCIASVKPIFECPDESFALTYTDTANGPSRRCEHIRVSEGQLTCAGGQERGHNTQVTLEPYGRRCLQQHEGEEDRSYCPAGFEKVSVKNGDLQIANAVSSEMYLCEEKVSPQISCPESSGFVYAPNDDQCLRTEVFKPALLCPKGSRFESPTGKCLIEVAQQPECLPGFDYVVERGLCRRVVPEVLAPCPEGFLETSDRHYCERMEIYAPLKSCPEGFNRTLESPMEFVQTLTHGDNLAKNSELGDKIYCTKKLISIPRCPAGFSLVREPLESTLSRSGSQNATETSDYCERILEESYVCPPGSKNSRAVILGTTHGRALDSSLPNSPIQCEVTLKEDVIDSCPPGFLIVKGHCERTELLAPILPEPVEEEQPVLSWACPPETEFLDHTEHPLCVHREFCVPGSVCNNKTLTRVPAIGICPPQWFIKNRNVCVRRVPQSLPKCLVGQLTAENVCLRTVRVPLVKDCPVGTQRQGDKHCVSIEFVEPLMVCPGVSVPSAISADSQLTQVCKERQPALTAAPMIINIPATENCPRGRLNETGECVATIRIERSFVCPDNTERIGVQCLHFEALEPEKSLSKFVSPTEVCPTTTVKQPDGTCLLISKRRPILQCPPGTVESSNGTRDDEAVLECVRRVAMIVPPVKTMMVAGHATTICPDDFEVDLLNSGTCIKRKITVPVAYCPQGYTLQDGEICEKVLGHEIELG